VIAAGQPGIAQAVDLRMHHLISLLHSSVPSSSYDPSLLNQDRSYGNPTFSGALAGLIQRRLHEDIHVEYQIGWQD
jgi:hypothetical protein